MLPITSTLDFDLPFTKCAKLKSKLTAHCTDSIPDELDISETSFDEMILALLSNCFL